MRSKGGILHENPERLQHSHIEQVCQRPWQIMVTLLFDESTNSKTPKPHR
jgi:hypothetical protein